MVERLTQGVPGTDIAQQSWEKRSIGKNTSAPASLPTRGA